MNEFENKSREELIKEIKELSSTQIHFLNFINSLNDYVASWQVPTDFRTDLTLEEQIEMLYNVVCVDANRTAWELYGFKSKNEIIGKKYIELIQKKTYDQIFADFINNNYQLYNYETYEKAISGSGYYGVESLYGIMENGKLTNLWVHTKNITEYKNELQKAHSEIRTLRGILPLCSFCKKIRDDKGYWEQVDVYIHKYSEADISHSVCPECMKQHYPDVDD